MVMTDANAFFAMCRPDQSIWGWLAGWLAACSLPCSHVPCAMCCVCMCAQQCIGESVLEPHLICVISHLSPSHLVGTGAGTKDQERNTALCAHPAAAPVPMSTA